LLALVFSAAVNKTVAQSFLPPSRQVYQNDAIGVSLKIALPQLQVVEDRYLSDAFGFTVVDPEGRMVLRVALLHRASSAQMEQQAWELVRNSPGLDLHPQSVRIGPHQGVKITGAPGVDPSTYIYLSAYGRLYEIVCPEREDNVKVCATLLESISFSTAIRSLEELGLKRAEDVLYEPLPYQEIPAFKGLAEIEEPDVIGIPPNVIYTLQSTLTDTDYHFSLKYPESWELQMTIDEMRGSDFRPEWILRRYSFIPGGLDIDIWVAQGMGLSSWLQWMGKITASFPLVEPNAMAGGYPAVAFIEADMVSVFVADGKYVYRFWLTLSNQENLKAYIQVLNTLRLPGTQKPGAMIPESLVEKATQILDTESRGSGCLLQQQGCTSIYNQGCCGLASAYCSTYFPCSRNNTGTDRGNCTWYVCYQYGAVPFRGHAGTWWSQVPNYAGWQRGYRPQVGLENIAWWSGNPGHVAYLENYQGGDQIVISEMSWCESCGRTRTIQVNNPTGYIWHSMGPTHASP